jgi:hypothetical protein
MTTRIGTALPREDDATDADRQAMQQLIERLRTWRWFELAARQRR